MTYEYTNNYHPSDYFDVLEKYKLVFDCINPNKHLIFIDTIEVELQKEQYELLYSLLINNQSDTHVEIGKVEHLKQVIIDGYKNSIIENLKNNSCTLKQVGHNDFSRISILKTQKDKNSTKLENLKNFLDTAFVISKKCAWVNIPPEDFCIFKPCEVQTAKNVELVLYLSRQEILFNGGSVNSLSEVQFNVLHALAKKSMQIVSNRELNTKANPAEIFSHANESLRQAIVVLRDLIGKKNIKNYTGRGYELRIPEHSIIIQD